MFVDEAPPNNCVTAIDDADLDWRLCDKFDAFVGVLQFSQKGAVRF